MNGFSVHAVVHLAVVPAEGLDDTPPPLDVPMPNALSERTRIAVNRTRVGHQTKEALYALIDGMATLERELYETRRQLALHRSGVYLNRDLVEIGPNGLRLQRPLDAGPAQRVHVYLALRVWSSERVLVFSARVVESLDGCALQFEPMRQEDHDAIVAFCFQQQGKERRRELDAAGSP